MHYKTLSLRDISQKTLMLFIVFSSLYLLLLMPLSTAQAQPKPTTPTGQSIGLSNTSGEGAPLQSVVDRIVNFFDYAVVPLLYAAAFFFFMLGVYQYYFTDEEKKRAKGRDFIIWGLVAMVVMFSVWGIVHMLVATLKV